MEFSSLMNANITNDIYFPILMILGLVVTDIRKYVTHCRTMLVWPTKVIFSMTLLAGLQAVYFLATSIFKSLFVVGYYNNCKKKIITKRVFTTFAQKYLK